MSDQAQQTFNLSGRVALVTGGGRDIGREIALSLGRAGADVVISYLSSGDESAKVIAELHALGVRALAIQTDILVPSDITALATAALKFGNGRVDILVNSAGGNPRTSPLSGIDPDLVSRTMALNFSSTILMCQAIVPAMVANNFGRVINVGSIAAATGGGPIEHHYAAAKAAVTSLARSLTNEFGKNGGLTFNTIAPGFVDNGFHTQTPDEVRVHLRELIPLGRTGVNADIGGAAVFLASNEASWISGDVININGGLYYGR